MTVLELEHVRRHRRHGSHEHVVLDDVSLQIDRGELVAILGARHSGRSTLLRIACGIEPPDAGSVRFAGRELTASGQALGSGIGFCRRPSRGGEGRTVLDELVIGQLARGVPQTDARASAWTALERTGATRSATCGSYELDSAEAVRVSIAVAIALEPSLLVIDEPTAGVEVLERDQILALLRSLADDGIAVLMSAGEAIALAGSDRALSLSEASLRGATSPVLAPVVPLRHTASA